MGFLPSLYEAIVATAALSAAGTAIATFRQTLRNTRLLEGDDDVGRKGIVEKVDEHRQIHRQKGDLQDPERGD